MITLACPEHEHPFQLVIRTCTVMVPTIKPIMFGSPMYLAGTDYPYLRPGVLQGHACSYRATHTKYSRLFLMLYSYFLLHNRGHVHMFTRSICILCNSATWPKRSRNMITWKEIEKITYFEECNSWVWIIRMMMMLVMMCCVCVCVLDKDMEHGRGDLEKTVNRRGSPGQNAQS